MNKLKEVLKLKKTWVISSIVVGGLVQVVPVSEPVGKVLGGIAQVLMSISGVF